MAAIIQVSITS